MDEMKSDGMTFLVPIDFSKSSVQALSYMTKLAEKTNASITLLHAYSTFPYPSVSSVARFQREVKHIQTQAEQTLREFGQPFEQSLGLKFEYSVAVGNAVDVIIRTANATKPDILIMGTEPISPVGHAIFGTITGRIIDESNCSILIIPEDAILLSPEKIAFATDFHKNDEEIMRLLSQFAKKLDAEFHITHVYLTDTSPKSFEFDEFHQRISQLNWYDKIFFKRIDGKNVVTQLQKFIESEDINILAVSKTRKSFLSKLISRSVSKKLFRRVNIPLMVLKREFESHDYML